MTAAARTRGLTIAAQAGAALTPEQRKYNQLVARIEKARKELLAWQEHVPLFAQAHATRIHPLMAELAALRRQLVLKVAGLIERDGWRKADRQTLRRALCERAADLTDNDFIDEGAAAELEALHDRHADNSLDDARREALDDMKGMFEAFSGVDLGDETFDSEEALLQRAQQRMQADAEHEAQRREQAQAQRPQRQSAAQRKRQAQQEQASKSVREVYRQLASALHPDRAEDDADRARRTALMQRVNQAYEKQDLLGLFALQLEIEQIDPAHLAHASTERLRHYNRVLAAQLAELQDEIELQADAFAMQFGIEPWRRLNPHKLGPLLEEDMRQIRVALVQLGHELQQLDQPAGVKRWLQQERQRQKLDDDDLFDLPF
jgi:hypothetical protein